MDKKIRCIQVGLGPIGNQTTRYLIDRGHIELIGGADVDPAKLGKDLGTLAGVAPLGVLATDSLDSLLAQHPQVAVVTTSSSLERVAPLLLQLVSEGVHVVSTCEELSYPWVTFPAISSEIDAAARRSGVAVLGTGVNPGFMMDYLPAAITAVCKSVKRIRVERIQDASQRRVPFQRKIGAGLTLCAFEAKVEEGTLRHVGLTESMHLIAAKMGWTLDKTEDIIEPVLASQRVVTPGLTIEPGQALGVHQVGRGFRGAEQLLHLEFRATIGEAETYDRILVEGEPDLDVKTVGVRGDIATCAITVNAIPVIVEAAPGLRTMADIAPISCYGQSG